MKQKTTSDEIKAPSTFPTQGQPASSVLKMIERELAGDGRTNYDLGSYTTIDMKPEANQLIRNSLGKNLINKNEYQSTTKIHDKLVIELGNYLKAPNVANIIGSSTVGSSEAIFLSLVAAKHLWRKKKLEGSPNIVITSNAHLSWHKFALYLDIEIRQVRLACVNQYPINEVIELVNKNTITVVGVLGCTYVGNCDPIEDLNNQLESLNSKKGWDIGIHVDAAIGGFILPFLDTVKHQWDFNLPLVRSINLSGHKYGLVYPGLGWIIFRDQRYFPRELSRTSQYLSGSFTSLTLNFSKPSSFVIAQYFNFLHFGKSGYKMIIRRCLNMAKHLACKLSESSFFEIIKTPEIPVVSFSIKENASFSAQLFTETLRFLGWMLPSYPLPDKSNKVVMRIVIRNDMTPLLLQTLIDDLIQTYKTLAQP